MPQADCKHELSSFLKNESKKLDITVMPDFFHDRLISLNYNTDDFSSLIADIARRKGGSIDGVEQTDIRGGNACPGIACSEPRTPSGMGYAGSRAGPDRKGIATG